MSQQSNQSSTSNQGDQGDTQPDRPTNAAVSSPGAVSQGSPTLTFKGGGWVILLSVVLVLLVMGWSLLGPMLGRRPIGDGYSLESYGYDLTTLAIDRNELVGSGFPRGFLPSRDDPKHLAGREMAIFNEQNRPKYVVTSDRVIGAVINGQPHAWPLSMLNAHEIVNDTVGGIPVAATYSPLCDTAIVFDRRIGDRAMKFEVSGLLSDSNLVFYDKSEEGSSEQTATTDERRPSLFLQLARKPVAGPLAKGATIEMFPDVCITTWADWLKTHPDTTVAERDPQTIRRMKEISYARYFLTPQYESPVSPLPDAAELAARGLREKSPVVAIDLGGKWNILAIESLLDALTPNADGSRETRLTVDGVELEVFMPKGPAVARVRRVDGKPLVTIPCLVFAANAILGTEKPLAWVEVPKGAGSAVPTASE